MKKASTRGGYREGSGRPPGTHGTKVTRSIRLTAAVSEYLTARHAGGIGDAIDALVRASREFKEWEKTR